MTAAGDIIPTVSCLTSVLVTGSLKHQLLEKKTIRQVKKNKIFFTFKQTYDSYQTEGNPRRLFRIKVNVDLVCPHRLFPKKRFRVH